MTTSGARRSSATHVLRDCGTAVALTGAITTPRLSRFIYPRVRSHFSQWYWRQGVLQKTKLRMSPSSLPAQACGRIEGSARISRHSVGVYFSDACCGRLLSSSIEERTKVRSRRSDAFIRTNGPTYEEENPSPCLSLLERERQNHPAAAAKQIFCRLARKENRHGTCRYAR